MGHGKVLCTMEVVAVSLKHDAAVIYKHRSKIVITRQCICAAERCTCDTRQACQFGIEGHQASSGWHYDTVVTRWCVADWQLLSDSHD